MRYLLDTNAASEPGRPAPNLGYMRWFESTGDEDICLSAVTVGELRRGVALLDAGPQKSRLDQLNAALVHQFGARVLPLDATVAEVWGELSARLRKAGRIFGAADEMIAATALAHELVLITRNTRHFEATGCELLAPWSG